jgi:hypothetical protein
LNLRSSDLKKVKSQWLDRPDISTLYIDTTYEKSVGNRIENQPMGTKVVVEIRNDNLCARKKRRSEKQQNYF